MKDTYKYKDCYYFSHDSNAKDDPKCVLLIEQLGLEGYGIFWVLIETLRDQPEYRYPVALIPALARRYNTSAEKMNTVINRYNLFVVDEDNFFSLSLIERMEKVKEKRENARRAGLESARKRYLSNGRSTNVQQTFNENITNVEQLKESIYANFDEFWAMYPNKKAKADAQKAWSKLSPNDELFKTIITALEKQKKSNDWTKETGKYVPYPATWIRGKRWQDEIKENNSGSVKSVFDRLLAEAEERDKNRGS